MTTNTDRCPVCGKPYTAHPGLTETCRENLQARDGLVKIQALCDALGGGTELARLVLEVAGKALGKLGGGKG